MPVKLISKEGKRERQSILVFEKLEWIIDNFYVEFLHYVPLMIKLYFVVCMEF